MTWPRPQSDVDNAVVAISDDGILIRAWGCDLDALNSIEEGAAVDFVPCTLPAHAVALCVVARGVIILGRDDVLRLIDRKGRQLDAVSFSCELIASSRDTVYALQGNELQQIEARRQQQRIASLVDAGEWLEALSSQVDAVGDDPSKRITPSICCGGTSRWPWRTRRRGARRRGSWTWRDPTSRCSAGCASNFASRSHF